MSDVHIKRDRQELDSIRFDLNALLETHRKPEVTDRVFNVYLTALSDCPTKTILDAIKKYSREGEHAPTPEKIYRLCQKNPRHTDAPKQEFKPCNKKIAKAWVICLQRFYGWAPKDNNPEIVLTFDEAIEICNREAARCSIPEAIPDSFKLNEFFGNNF